MKVVLFVLAGVVFLAQVVWLGVFLYFFAIAGWCFTCTEGAAYLTLFALPLWIAIEIPIGIVTLVAVGGIVWGIVAQRAKPIA